MYSTDKVDAVRVEVNKRGDKQYGVWQYFTMFDALRNYELRGIFHQNNLDYSDEELLDFTDAKDIERVFPKSVGRWILVSVQRNKKEANVSKNMITYLLRTSKISGCNVIKVLDG